MPHSLTEWVGSSFCTNEKSGLGVSDVATVRGFQPFFASFTLPYSVVRGERVPIIVTVFNYLSECLVVSLVCEAHVQTFFLHVLMNLLSNIHPSDMNYIFISFYPNNYQNQYKLELVISNHMDWWKAKDCCLQFYDIIVYVWHQVELTLKKSSSYRVLQNARKAKICVCGGKAQSHTFTIIANQLGDVNITVKVTSRFLIMKSK